jgi:MoCo/4Fe-4S cofactor protein with predicted Tat translocation signal
MNSGFPLPVIGSQKPAAPEASAEQPSAAKEYGYGKAYWRSIAEKNAPEKLQAAAAQEFTPAQTEAPKGFARRDFLQLMGASMALAGLTACSERPVEPILPYTKNPDNLVPGNPLHYASAWSLRGYASGLLVTAREGRPVKVEGNPDHPFNQGKTGVYEQALTIQLYDPQRARMVRHKGSGASWRTLRELLVTRGQEWAKSGGEGLRFLMEPSSSPLGGELRAQITKRFPKAKFYAHTPLFLDNALEGANLAFGQPLSHRYELEKADVVVSLDADFLQPLPEHLKATRGFGTRRTIENPSRIYAIEHRLTVTGSASDQRLRMRASDIAGFTRALAAELSGSVAALAPFRGLDAGRQLSAKEQKWVKAVAADLARAQGKSLVAVGEGQPAEVHALGYAINAALKNVGETLVLHAPVQHEPLAGPAQLAELTEEIKGGKVETLIITAWNPVYNAAADLDFKTALQKVPTSIYLGMFEDETAQLASWFVPAAHPLEIWGDTRAQDGSVSLIQPLINPLFGGMSEYDLLAAFLDRPETTTHQLLQDFWSGKVGGAGFQTKWEEWLSKGLVAGQEAQPVQANLAAEKVLAAVKLAKAPAAGLELNFVPSYHVFDGRFGNAPWCQEMPDPITKLTWDNAVYLSEATAKAQKVQTGDLAKLSVGGNTIEAAVMVVPGHADDSLTLALGYGRTADAEGIAKGVGFDAYRLRTSKNPFIAPAELKATGDQYEFSLTQEHNTLDGQNGEYRTNVAFIQTLEEFKKHPEAEDARGALPTLLEPVVYEGYQWAMGIDLSRCTGCSACVIACQAENNVPTVGREQVRKNREMHWLRIDRYFTGPVDEPEVINQPMYCQHCEAAPCEYVCPVNATTHSDEGLNDMVYNRCIGTRYCSNNCPYKVRRFNYFHWNAEKDPMVQMAMNPDVTVRARGVMEKCTYCVQRIERVRIQARIEGRQIRQGELVSACAQACPTNALVFGTLSEPKSEVVQWHQDERRYDVLHELNTRPRNAYLTKVTNPNPELA